MIDFLLGLFVCLFFWFPLYVSSSVSPSLPVVRFGQILRYADTCLVNIMKVYIERINLQVELIGCRNNIDFIHVYFCEATESIQYRS